MQWELNLPYTEYCLVAVGFYWQSMDQSSLKLSLDSNLSATYCSVLFLWDLLQDVGSSQEGPGLESTYLAIVK